MSALRVLVVRGLFFFIGVPGRVGFKIHFPFERAVEFGRWNRIFFGDRVTEDGDRAAMEEIQDSKMDVAVFGAQFIDAVAQVISRGTTEFVSHFGEE